MEARRGRILETYLPELCSLRNILKKVGSGEDSLFRINLPASRLQRSSIGGQVHSTSRFCKGVEQMHRR